MAEGGLWRAAAGWGLRMLDGLGESALFLRVLIAPPSPVLLRRGLMDWGVRTLGLVALIFLIMGLVIQVQAERAVVDLGFSNRVPELFMLAVTKSAPLVVGILLAGRCGSAVAAQTGWRALSMQDRALVTMGVDPERSFFPPLFWSWLIVTPVLTAAGVGVALLLSAVFLASPLSRAQITPLFFMSEVGAHAAPATVAVMALKGAAMAGGAAVIAYRSGAAPKRSSGDVTSGHDARTGAVVCLAGRDRFCARSVARG
jgi:ABC-type transporter Mla maintaining outer membrane lipid asymmetry permease subunit MlaE